MNLYINDAESRLRSSIHALNNAKDATGICFHLSKLINAAEPSNSNSIALNVIRDQFKNCLGDIYAFKNGDVIIVYRGRNEKTIKDCVYQVQYLFSDDNDQLSFSETFFSPFYNIYDRSNWDRFIAHCDNSTKFLDRDKKSEHFKGSLIGLFSSIIEDLIEQANWDVLVRQSGVYKDTGKGQPAKVLDEIHIDIDALAYIIGENFDIVENSYLRSFLREFLDIKLLLKLLELIRRDPGKDAYLLALSLNTLSSLEFRELSNSISEAVKRRIIIGVSVADVFSDLTYFLKVREELLRDGYKLCLDSLDYLSFMQVDRNSLGFDLMRLSKPKAENMTNFSEIEQQIADKIAVSGSSRVILEVGSRNDIDLGRKLGVVLFQTDK